MATTQIQFKPDFELKLKRLRIKTRFIKCIQKYINSEKTKFDNRVGHLSEKTRDEIENHRLIDSAMILNKHESWQTFIADAFPWAEDDFNFWNKIARRTKF